MKLDLTSLQKAIGQLDQTLAYADSPQAHANPEVRRVFQTAAIKAFEFTYELSWKVLKRHLEGAAAAAQTIDELGFSGFDSHGQRARVAALGVGISHWNSLSESFRESIREDIVPLPTPHS